MLNSKHITSFIHLFIHSLNRTPGWGHRRALEELWVLTFSVSIYINLSHELSSQKEVAKETDYNENIISDIERGVWGTKVEREQNWEQRGQERIVSIRNLQGFHLCNFMGCLKHGREKSRPRCSWNLPPTHKYYNENSLWLKVHLLITTCHHDASLEWEKCCLQTRSEKNGRMWGWEEAAAAEG